MIAKLVLLDAVGSWRRWLASFVVMVFAALIALVCAGDFSTANAMSDPGDAQGLRNHAMIFGGLNSVVVVGALGVLVQFSIRSRRRELALWQFAGIGPRLIRNVVLAQTAAVALVALVVALVTIPAVLSTVMTVLSAPTRDLGAPPLVGRLGIGEVAIASAVYLAVVLLGAIGAAREAQRTPAIVVVRDAEELPAAPGRGRWITGLVFAAVAATGWVFVLLGERGISSMFLVPAIGAVICAAPWICGPLLRGWTRLVPERWSATWYVARNAAAHASARSHAAVSLLAVAMLLSVLLGVAGLYDNASMLGTGLVIFGGPVALVLYTGVATVFMTTAGRTRESALLVVGGGTVRTAVGVALCEAAIVVGTAFIVAAPIAALTLPATSALHPMRIVVAMPVLALLGFVVMASATLLPVRRAGRPPLGRHLVEQAG